MFESGDDRARVLYKYRSCEAHHIQSLSEDAVWFSTAAQLNDPFDCLLRLPAEAVASDIDQLRRVLARAEPYNLPLATPLEIATHIGKSSEMAFLEPLGMMAAQLGHDQLLDHLRVIELSDEWIGNLVAMAREITEVMFRNVTVFCLSERRDEPLMWAHYARSHSGFATGYVAPVGIDSPRLIHKVRYAEAPPTVTNFQLVEDPGAVYQDLILTKPTEWSYEAEWRVTFGNLPGLTSDLLPYREVILGANISRQDERSIRKAVGDRKVTFFRVRPDHGHGRFGLDIEPA